MPALGLYVDLLKSSICSSGVCCAADPAGSSEVSSGRILFSLCSARLSTDLPCGFLVETVRVKREQITPSVRNPPDPRRGRIDISTEFEHAQSPAAAVSITQVGEVRESLRALSLCQPQQVRHRFVNLPSLVTVRMCGQMPEDGVIEGSL